MESGFQHSLHLMEKRIGQRWLNPLMTQTLSVVLLWSVFFITSTVEYFNFILKCVFFALESSHMTGWGNAFWMCWCSSPWLSSYNLNTPVSDRWYDMWYGCSSGCLFQHLTPISGCFCMSSTAGVLNHWAGDQYGAMDYLVQVIRVKIIFFCWIVAGETLR